MKKNCRTKAQMYPIIEGFSSSGLTCKAYAKSLGMKYGTYKYWVRKYRADQKASSNKSVTPNFIPIKVVEEKLQEHQLDIMYPNGVQLRLTSSLDTLGSVTLKKLVSCLD
jgi:transposase